MRITSITFPEGNKILDAIHATRTFKASVYNLKQDLKYLRQYATDKVIRNYAIQYAKEHSIAEYESMIVKYPEYVKHPDLIEATRIYNELMRTSEIERYNRRKIATQTPMNDCKQVS